ncbi:hypothetical protein GO627_12710 [Aeromonas veronii]|nr:hypothetical protein GO627_12710 [Aeromonas veronii]
MRYRALAAGCDPYLSGYASVAAARRQAATNPGRRLGKISRALSSTVAIRICLDNRVLQPVASRSHTVQLTE